MFSLNIFVQIQLKIILVVRDQWVDGVTIQLLVALDTIKVGRRNSQETPMATRDSFVITLCEDF